MGGRKGGEGGDRGGKEDVLALAPKKRVGGTVEVQCYFGC